MGIVLEQKVDQVTRLAFWRQQGPELEPEEPSQDAERSEEGGPASKKMPEQDKNESA